MVRHGRCWTTPDRQHHRPCRRSLSPPRWIMLFAWPRQVHEPCPLSARGTNHEGLGSVAEALSRSSWPTLALHPRGGHWWLSAAIHSPITELEKIEKLLLRGTLGALTSFKSLGFLTLTNAIHRCLPRSRTMSGYLRKPPRSNRMRILGNEEHGRSLEYWESLRLACLSQHRY